MGCSLQTKTTKLACWVLLHIWATAGLAAQIREEIAPHAKTTQKPQLFAIPEPLQLKIDLDGLLWSCTSLQSCFLKCERLYCMSTFAAVVKKNCALSVASVKPMTRAQSSDIRIEAGTYLIGVHTARTETLQEAERFMPQRWKESKVRSGQADLIDTPITEACQTDRNADVEQFLVECGVFSIVAGVLTLWDLSPVLTREWQIPHSTTSSPYRRPNTNVRVMIAQRNLSE